MPPEGSATAAVLEAAPLTAQPEAAAPQPAQAAVEAPPRPPPSVVTPAQQPTQPPAADDDADDTQQPSTSGRAEEEQHQQSSKQATTTRRYMAYFLQRLWDFREPELRALASMYGVDDLQVEPVPQGGLMFGVCRTSSIVWLFCVGQKQLQFSWRPVYARVWRVRLAVK